MITLSKKNFLIVAIGFGVSIIIFILVTYFQAFYEDTYYKTMHIYAPNHIVYVNDSLNSLLLITKFNNVWPKPAIFFSEINPLNTSQLIKITTTQVCRLENSNNFSTCNMEIARTGAYELYVYTQTNTSSIEKSYLVQINGKETIETTSETFDWAKIWTGDLNKGLQQIKISEKVGIGGLGRSSLIFNGKDNYIEVPYSKSINIQNFSVEAWINCYNPRMGKYQTFFANGGSTYSYILRVDNDGFIFFSIHDGSTEKYIRSDTKISNNTFYHVVGTFDVSTLRGYLYINGIKQASELIATMPPRKNSQPLTIGGSPYWKDWFNGIIDEVRVYNRTLSQKEIKINYLNLSPLKNGLVLWFPINEGEGDTVHDLSGFNNDGINHGSSWGQVTRITRAPNGLLLLYTNSSNNAPVVEYVKDDPTRYIVKAEAEQPFILVFSETFDEGWKAYYGTPNWVEAFYANRIQDNEHFSVNGYANAWYFNKTGSIIITLYFLPQSLYYIGIIVSSGTMTALTIYILYGFMSNILKSLKILFKKND
jgi:hypothetical protein